MNKVVTTTTLHIPTQKLKLSDCTLLPDENSVQSHGSKVKLEPKVFQVLFCLAQQQGLVVSRQALLDQVWPDRVLTDDAVNRCIFQARKCLKQLNSEIQIKTHAKSGYQLIATPGSVRTNNLYHPYKYYAVLGIIAAMISWLLFFTAQPVPEYQRSGLLMSDKMERYPQASPNGNLLAFARQTANGMAIVLKQLNADAERIMTDGQHYDHQPDFSPDQQQLVFARILPDKTCVLIIMTILDRQQKQIGRCQPGGVYDLQWHPLNNSLIYIDRQHSLSPPRLNKLQINSGHQQDISPALGQGVDDFHLTDKGELFLSIQLSLGVEDIYRAESDKLEQLTPVSLLKAKVHGLAWQPIHQRLYFTSNRRGPFQLWSVQADGNGMKHLVAAGEGGDEISIDHNGTIYLEKWQQQSEIIALSLATKKKHVITPGKSNNWQLQPVQSQDSLFISDRSGSAELWFKQAEKLRQLTQEKGHWLLTFDYHPTQQKLAYSYPFSSGYQAKLLDLSTTSDNFQSLHNAFSPVWSVDGQSIYFTRQRQQQNWTVWRTELITGASEQLPLASQAKIIKRSIDGKILYFTHPHKPGLWRATLDTASIALITPDLQIVDQFNWQPFSKGVYYIGRNNQGVVLKQYLSATRETTTLTVLDNFLYFSGLRLNQDETELYYSRIKHQDADIFALKKMPD